MLKEDEMVLAFISQHPKTCLTAITKALDVQQAIVVGSLGRLQRAGAIQYTYKKVGERDNPSRPLDFEYEFQVLRPSTIAGGGRDVTWAELVGRTPPPLADSERSVIAAIEQTARRGVDAAAVADSSLDSVPASAPCAVCGTTATPNLIVRHIKTKHGDYGLQRLCRSCGHALGDLDMEEYRGRLYANAMNALAEVEHILSLSPGSAKATAMLAHITLLQDTFDSRSILFQCEIDAGGKAQDRHE
jgi:hypothetical protein